MQVDKVEILFTKQELKEMQKYAEIEKKSAIGALCDWGRVLLLKLILLICLTINSICQAPGELVRNSRQIELQEASVLA